MEQAVPKGNHALQDQLHPVQWRVHDPWRKLHVTLCNGACPHVSRLSHTSPMDAPFFIQFLELVVFARSTGMDAATAATLAALTCGTSRRGRAACTTRLHASNAAGVDTPSVAVVVTVAVAVAVAGTGTGPSTGTTDPTVDTRSIIHHRTISQAMVTMVQYFFSLLLNLSPLQGHKWGTNALNLSPCKGTKG